MSNRRNRADIDNALAELRKRVSPGDTVYTILRHVSSSGMSRVISLYTFPVENGKASPSWLSRWVHNADIGNGWDDRREGVKVGGCGMDMGFHLVYSLSRALFPEGYGEPCVHCGYRCQTKDEADLYARNQVTFPNAQCPGRHDGSFKTHEFRGRNGDSSGWSNDGGYALKQEWL